MSGRDRNLCVLRAIKLLGGTEKFVFLLVHRVCKLGGLRGLTRSNGLIRLGFGGIVLVDVLI
jgi:hypothetical protein